MITILLNLLRILILAAITAGTMGMGCAAAQGSRLASGVVATIDTLEGLGAARGLVEGGTDMVQNGVNLNNSVQVASGLLLGIGLANKSCFTAGTQVVVGEIYDEELCTTTYVTSNIEDIKVGDLVYSYDTITGEVSQKEVTDTFVRTSNHINYLTIIDENGHEQVIETTDSPPFWVVTDNPDLSRAAQEIVSEDGTILYHENLGVTEHGYWIEAKDLREGDVFLGANGELSTLVFTERVEFPEGITVYNFTVDGNHDYFVIAQKYEFGQTCILVHNADNRLYRQGLSKESAARLERKSSDAESKISIHGVSASGKQNVTIPSSIANRADVEKQFKVHNTPHEGIDPLHVTIELPKPVTKEIADIFNKLFGRIK